jgi:hypothetical protein
MYPLVPSGGLWRRWSEAVAELVRGEICVSQDAAQRPTLELLVERHNKECAPFGMAEADVAAALTDDFQPRRSSARIS